MSEFREESEQHVVHRLESFSDIVIGFALAMLTLNLKLPARASDLFAKDSVTIVAFVLTFTLVASVWWLHHKLFTYYFVPTALNVMLNFAALGGTLFLVYSEQIYLHGNGNDPVAYALFCGAYSFVLVIVAVMMALGIRLRSHRMAPYRARRGTIDAIRIALMAFAMGSVTLLFALSRAADARWIVPAVACVLIYLRLFERRAMPPDALAKSPE